MDQERGPDNGSIDYEKLLDYLDQTEARFSKFSQSGGGAFLLNAMRKLQAQPDVALQELRQEFSNVVEHKPNLLEVFSGNWVGFLLWDNFNEKMHVLHKYSLKNRKDCINGSKYRFVSDFVESPEFRKNDFSEPMTDIIFANKSKKKRTLIFSWKDSSELSELISDDDRKYLRRCSLEVCYDALGGERWIAALASIDISLDAIIKQQGSNHAEHFGDLARQISALAENIIRSEKGAAQKKIFKKAADRIRRGFESQEKLLVKPQDLCRTLIWNRLFDNTWKHLYYIPAQFLAGSPVSGIVCALRKPLGRREYVLLSAIVNRIFSLFHFGAHMQQIHIFALRSATAAIMARNKSHIHGSHIEHGLRNRMASFEEVIKQRLGDESQYYRRLREKLSLTESGS